MMKPAASYSRVSSIGQKHNTSLDAQQKATREDAEREGYEFIAELSNVESGAERDRDGLNELIDLVCANSIEAVFILRIDRLCRSKRDYYYLRDLLAEYGIRLHTNDDGWIEDDPDDIHKVDFDILFASRERKMIRDRLLSGRKHVIEVERRTLGLGPYAPYGYRYVSVVVGQKTRRALEVIPDEAEVVLLMYVWYLEGLTVYAVAQRLTERRIPTPSLSGKRTKKSDLAMLGQWNGSTVNKILRSETYAGVFYHNRYKRVGRGKKCQKITRTSAEEWNAVDCPAIIEREMWEAVQARLHESRSRYAPNGKRTYLLGRRISCVCGYAMNGNYASSYPQYRCGHKPRVELNGEICRHGAVSAKLIEPVVWQWLLEELAPDRLRAGIERDRTLVGVRTERLQQQLASLHKRRGDLEAELQRLIAALRYGAISPQELATQRTPIDQITREVKQEIAEVEKEMQSEGLRDDEVTALLAEAEELHYAARTYTTLEDRRRLLDRLDVRVKILVGDDGHRLASMTGRLSLEPTVRPLSAPRVKTIHSR